MELGHLLMHSGLALIEVSWSPLVSSSFWII